MGVRVGAASVLVLIMLAALATPALGVGGGPLPSFTDVSDHWGEAAILKAAGEGWIAGCPDGTFRPEAPVTRAEALTLLVRALQNARYLVEPEIAPEELVSEYSGNPLDHWAVQNGVLLLAHATLGASARGLGADAPLAPDQPATRLEAAVWLARAANPALRDRLEIQIGRRRDGWSPEAQAAALTGLEGIAWPFSDTVVESWQPYVLQAVKSGLVLGFPDGRFGGAEGVTRAQMVAMVERLAPVARLAEGLPLGTGPEAVAPSMPGHGKVVEVLLREGGAPGQRRLSGDRRADWPALARLTEALRSAKPAQLPAGVSLRPFVPPHRRLFIIRYEDGWTDDLWLAFRCQEWPDGTRTCGAEPGWLDINGTAVHSDMLWDYYFGQANLDMAPVMLK
ncbi:MAG: S-layer homology domain-containing protein [Symbiobacteriia bacterium]